MTRKFDWKSRHDTASKKYPVSAVASPVEKPVFWREGVVLDQGAEGACVGFGWEAELLAAPRPFNTEKLLAENHAKMIYQQAKIEDEWPGEDYEGTSVLAGAKVVKDLGYIGEYRWCFSVDDVRAALSLGPVVIGIPWYENMYETRPSGLVEIGGRLVGGHCITLTGYHPKMRIKGEGWFKRHEVFRWRNSWGTSYGVNGSGLIHIEDLATLLADQGEACVPLLRSQVRY